MDIKLRARLSAYSKIESLEGLQNNIPVPDNGDYGSIIGVGENGKYTLFSRITTEDIDSQLDTTGAPDVVSKEAIDSLFTLQNESIIVDKADIDTLFTKSDEPDAVEKEEIDTLFKKESNESIGTISYAEIDSLFK